MKIGARVRIISRIEGNGLRTQVLDSAGRDLSKLVQTIDWHCAAGGGPPVARLVCPVAEIDADAEVVGVHAPEAPRSSATAPEVESLAGEVRELRAAVAEMSRLLAALLDAAEPDEEAPLLLCPRCGADDMVTAGDVLVCKCGENVAAEKVA